MSFRAAVLIGLLAAMLSGIGVVSAQGSSSGSLADDPFKTHDDLLLEVHHLASGFGGMFLSDDNTILYAWMLDPSEGEAVKKALEQVFGEWVTEGLEFQAVQGKYDIGQLYEWYSRKRDAVWAIPDVHMTDIDERDNRLWIGVDDLGVRREIEKALTDLGIPLEAVVIAERPRPQLARQPLQAAHKLTDRAASNKMVGGYAVTGEGFGTCTLGYNADRAGVEGFVTAGHCTQDKNTWGGGVQNTKFYQPSKSVNPTAIGQEKTDPGLSADLRGCPSGHQCRFSDAAFIEYASGVSRTLGTIAKPLSYRALTVSSSESYRIVKDVTSTRVNETVYKVGRVTGLTSGKVERVCADQAKVIRKPSGDVVVTKLLCQVEVKGLGKVGDSGSPVFRITNSPSQNDVELLGLLWGVNAFDPANPWFWYSKANHIFGELQRDPDNPSDTWNTCASSFNC